MKIQFFTRHMKKHGVLVDSKTAQTKMTVNLKCELCEYEAKRVEHITRHVETVHSDERKYLCQTCGIGFKRRDALKLHNVVHTSYGDELEPDLNQNAEHKNTALIEHSFSQGSQKNFKCNPCSKGFSTLALLQKHSHAHHSNPDAYVCEVCSKTFNTLFNLKRHSRAPGGGLAEAGDCPGYPPGTMDQLEIDNGEMLPQTANNVVTGGNQAKVEPMHDGFIVEKTEATFLKPTERWRVKP
jgi:DNA-directed RNA polymerase subunit RPC12/RpoP